MVDGVVVTVDAVVVSIADSGGIIELMSSEGASVVGVARHVLSRSDTMLSEDCGVLLFAGGCWVVVLLEEPPVVVVSAELAVCFEVAEDRVFPREDIAVAWVLEEDHMSLSVHGDFALLVRDEGFAEGGSMSMSISSPDGGGG